MTTASASETPIAGAAPPSQQAQPDAVLARAVAAAAVPARESPPRAAMDRLAATGPVVSVASQPAGRAVEAVSAAMRPSGLEASRSAEQAAAVIATATAPAGSGLSRCAEPAASVVVAVRVLASQAALTVLSEVRRAASAPVWAPAEQAVTPVGLWQRAAPVWAPAEQAVTSVGLWQRAAPVWAPAEQAVTPVGLWQRAAASVGPQWRAAVLAGPVSPRVVVPATRASSARDAQESAPMAASSTRPRRRRQPESAEPAGLVAEPDWRRRRTAAAGPNAKGLRPRPPSPSACAWSARAAVSRTKRPARASIRAGSGRPATLRSYAAATQQKSSNGGISKERFTSPTHGQEEETLLNLPV